MKRALILGIGGQDGSYLAETLLEKGYEVHGLSRRSSVDNLYRLEGIRDRIILHKGDLADQSVLRVIGKVEPDELYNEADQDNLDWSYATPGYSMDVTAGAVGRILESIKGSNVKFFQPLSATMFSGALVPQNEQTSFAPASPYACAKVAAYYLCQHYRREHGVFVSTAIMYNHDSPRRGEGYLLQKICKAAVNIARGRQNKMKLENLDQLVDIGFAGDYMKAAWQIVQLEKPDDFVIGSYNVYSIRSLVEMALKEAGEHPSNVSLRVEPDPDFHRPGGVPCLYGDVGKAKRAFDYFPETTLSSLIKMVVEKYKRELA